MTALRKIMAHTVVTIDKNGYQEEYPMGIASVVLEDSVVKDVSVQPFNGECAGVEFYNGKIMIKIGQPLQL